MLRWGWVTWVGLCAIAGSARAQECPDAGALYALREARAAELRAVARVAGVRTARVTRAERRQGCRIEEELVLRGVWPPSGGTCAQAVVDIRVAKSCPDRDGDAGAEVLAERTLLIEGDRRPGRFRLVRELGPEDPARITGTLVPDVTNDGRPEHLRVGEEEGDVCGGVECGESECDCVRCGLPGALSMTVRSAAQVLADRVHFEGRPRDEALEASARRAIGDRGVEEDAPCPAWRGRWRMYEPIGEPGVRPTAGGLEIAVRARVRECRGLSDPAYAFDPICGAVATRLIVERRAGGVTRREEQPARDGGLVTVGAAGCDTCIVTARRWRLGDGDATPHAIPVRFGDRDRSEAVGPAESRVALLPGVYAVEVSNPTTRTAHVYQVTVAPDAESPIDLPAPERVSRGEAASRLRVR